MILYQSPELTYPLKANHFEIDFWQNDVHSSRLVGGRGASQKILLNDKECVLRRYLRGGLAANISYDQYIWLGKAKARPYQECEILNHAVKQGLPVPHCLAYSIEQQGLFYRAAIITEYIPNSGTLAGYLERQSLSQHQWEGLAHVISDMHLAKINHADLNADNILIAQKLNELTFSIIDFDKAKLESRFSEWPENNIKRLLRSLTKLKPKYFDAQALAHFKASFNV